MHYCDHALSVSCRPSSLIFHIFDFESKSAEQKNLTGRKISTSFNKFVFFGPIGKPRWQRSLWLPSSLYMLNALRRNFRESKNLMSFTTFVFLGRSENKDGRLVVRLAEKHMFSDWTNKMIFYYCEILMCPFLGTYGQNKPFWVVIMYWYFLIFRFAVKFLFIGIFKLCILCF